MLAIKYNEDKYYLLTFYSEHGGCSFKNLVEMESAYLDVIDFNLYVDQVKFYDYFKNIVKNKIIKLSNYCICK